MQGLEAAIDEADHLLHTANKRLCRAPQSVEKNGKLSSTFFSIHQKLRQLYEKEVANTSQQSLQNLRPTSRLLEKLVDQENLNTLVLNLYPGNKGYSMCLKMGRDNVVETVKFPYQEDQLLTYIDNEELPAALADLLERSHPEIYYSGCVIAQIRDYRQTFPHYMCDTHHVLLRPSNQSIINDVNMITSDGDWTSEEKLLLESQLVLATQGPLCLDPSPAVGVMAQRIHHMRHALNTPSLRSTARRHNQIAVNRKRKLDQVTAKPLPHLAEFLAKKKSQPSRHAARTHSQQAINNVAKHQKKDDQHPPIDYWADVHRFAKPLDRPLETLDCTPLLVEEYILETERGMGRVYYIKLSILQRPSNCEFLGQLYVDKEYREGESNGASCRFSLGSRAQANRYIQQFTEIFTEEGRKSVRITHIVPGQPARVICTAGMRERTAKIAAQSLLQQHQQTLKQVLSAMSQQQIKLQKAVQAQKEQLVQVAAPSQTQIQVPNVSGHLGQSSESCSNSMLSNVTINGLGLISSLNPTSSHNGSVSNGEVAPKVTHTPVATQSSKPVIMTNPAISALANDLKNSVQQYQQQAAAAAAANAAANAAATAAANTANSSVNFVNHHSSSTSNNHGNTAILSLLNSNTSTSATVANPTLNQLLNTVIAPTPQQQTLNPKILTRKMTLTNILNSRLLTPSTNATTTSPVRVSLLSLTNQLSSPPVVQQKLTTGRLVQATLSGNVQTKTQTVQTIAPGNVQGLSGNVQTLRRVSTVTAQETTPTSSLGLSMPGLSALLAGTPSADNPVPGATNSGSSLLERLSTPPSYPSSSPKPPPAPSPSSINLNIASLQGAMVTSIPGLQNMQASKPVIMTNPAISALANDLKNSAQQFQQQAANAVSDNQVAGGSNSNSTLLERLSTPPSYPSSSPKPPPAPSPSSINLNLASIQGAMASIPGLQNVQVSIPGLAVPISVSLNVSAPHIVTTLPTSQVSNVAAPAATMVITNSNQAQLLTHVKSPNSQQTLRSPTTVSACNIAGAQSIQLLGTIQRPRAVVTTTNKPTLMARSVINTQRHTLKVAPSNSVISSGSSMTGNTQVLTLSPQQQLQIQAIQKQAIQKQAQLQLQQCLSQQVQQQPTAFTVKPRRRSNAADNK
uniref:Spt20-like SEP domain-containing protein n=1 Tax=Clastoptera arizonana TaxID=38151 RepID=A0A1B6EGG4_9HEMI